MTDYHCNLKLNLRWCQITANCTTATTRRTKTAVTATPNTAKVDYMQNAGHYTYHIATAKLDSGVLM